MAELAALEAMMDLDMNTNIGSTSPGGHSSAMGGPGSGTGGGGHHGGAEGGAGGGHSRK